MKSNIIADKSFDFSVQIIHLSRVLNEQSEFILSKQILRCGTSIEVNVEEAEGGISKKDFIAKLQIAYREAKETRYWLRFLIETTVPSTAIESRNLLEKCEEIIRIIVAILKSSKDENNDE